ncbi:MAG: DUF4136 domain-containing protein [Bryobacteraceae bacterium]
MKRNILLSAAFVIGAALLFAADVKTDYSHSVDFGNYHTYSWLKVDAGNPLWVDRIKRDVSTELMAKGWMEVPSGGDAAISAFGATHNQQSLQTFYDGFGGGWRWGGFGPDLSTTTTVNTPVGTLVVDIFDAHNKHLIWRGTSEKTLSDKPEKNEKKLEYQVKDMFKHFPPAPKS